MRHIAVRETELFVVNLRARIPFQYGITTMRQVPHLMVRAVVEVNGRSQPGISADHLPPKWFTKCPATSYRDDVRDMLEVIQHASDAARRLPPAVSVFDWWCELSAAQREWASGRRHPPLLFNFGVSLMERAVVDAFCRATKQTFAHAVRDHAFGLRLGEIHPELEGQVPAGLLPPEPLRSIIVRHTIGPVTALAISSRKRSTNTLRRRASPISRSSSAVRRRRISIACVMS